MTYRLGIDVGGTFTDFLLVGEEARLVHKVSSTPDDPSQAVASGIQQVAARLELEPRDLAGRIELIVHGTTVATNATLTRRGARSGLLVTEGFRDVLALRDGTREETYNNRLRPPDPLVPRRRSVGIPERIDAQGAEATPLDETALREAIERLRDDGVEAVAISFMHSPTEPAHERRAADIVRELIPGAYVTASSDLLPQIRYYERTSTTVLNVYVGPIVTRYMEALEARLAELGFAGVLLIMQSNGGVASPREVSRRAALSLLSGPASGPTAGLTQLAPHGLSDCITIDMGGTSFEAALVRDGRPLVMTDGEIDRWRLALPMIDIHTIGAGGGSTARVEAGGLLQVGPDSAGAVPGPACYGRGGNEPTVTDADLVLGYLSEATFLRGELALERAAAERALARIAEPLSLSLPEAAAGVCQLVDVTMATGIREVSVRRGLDPREFPLVVAGGAGPLHAAAIATELEIPLLLVPRESSVFCASGMLMCDFKHDFVRALKARLSEIDPRDLGELLEELAARGQAILEREGVASERVDLHASLDLRYVGQWHELNLPVAWDLGERPDPERIAAAFHAEHDTLFGYSSQETPVESLSVRLEAVGRTPKPDLGRGAIDGGDTDEALLGTREVWSASDRTLRQTPVYDGQALGSGANLDGPAVLELANTTIVVPKEFDVDVDRFGSFLVHTGSRGQELADRLKVDGVGVRG